MISFGRRKPKKPRKRTERKFGPYSEFISALLRELDNAGIQTWGWAGRTASAQRKHLACLDYQGVIQHVRLYWYTCRLRVTGRPICRIAINTGPPWPNPKYGIHADFRPCKKYERPYPFRRGMSREINISEAKLLDAVPFLVGIITGEIVTNENYLWDRRICPGVGTESVRVTAGRVQYVRGPLS